MENNIVTALMILWPLSEIILGITRRARSHKVKLKTGSYRLIWVVISISVGSAFAVQSLIQVQLPGSVLIHLVTGICLIISGLIIRWMAILTLGKAFTVDVAVRDGQNIIQTGLYKQVRHPSYSGMLISFTGLGIFIGNCISLVLIVVPITAVLIHRIKTEEKLLLTEFGDEYSEYRKNTARLIPGVY